MSIMVCSTCNSNGWYIAGKVLMFIAIMNIMHATHMVWHTCESIWCNCHDNRHNQTNKLHHLIPLSVWKEDKSMPWSLMLTFISLSWWSVHACCLHMHVQRMKAGMWKTVPQHACHHAHTSFSVNHYVSWLVLRSSMAGQRSSSIGGKRTSP